MNFRISIDQLKKIKSIARDNLNGSDYEFFNRVWGSSFNNYETRIKSIKFCSLNKVLDAGCGFGQWSIVLSMLNKEVYSIDIDKKRMQVLDNIKNELNITNLNLYKGTIDKMNFENNFFNAIFCYSSIYFTDFKKTIKEFHRILKPGGKLYINTNGIGWYLYNLIEGHNQTVNFDSKKMAMNAFNNSLKFFTDGILSPQDQLIIPSSTMINKLNQAGFFKIIKESDGGIIIDKNYDPESFYPPTYYNYEGVYEILAWKKK